MIVAGFFEGVAVAAVSHTDVGFYLAGFVTACSLVALMMWRAGPRSDRRRGGMVHITGEYGSRRVGRPYNWDDEAS